MLVSREGALRVAPALVDPNQAFTDGYLSASHVVCMDAQHIPFKRDPRADQSMLGNEIGCGVRCGCGLNSGLLRFWRHFMLHGTPAWSLGGRQ